MSRSSHVRQRAASWPPPGSFVVVVVTAGRASACGWQTLGVAALVTPCVGLLLAIAGVSCAGGAVFQTWREHEHRPLFPVLAATISRGRAAARRLKWWEPEREEVQGSLTLSAEFSLQAHGTVTGPNIPADAPVDEAVRLLVRRVERIEENAREARQQHKTSVKELRTELASHGGCATGDRRRSASSHEGCRHQHREPAALGTNPGGRRNSAYDDSDDHHDDRQPQLSNARVADDVPSTGESPRRDVGVKCACGVATQWPPVTLDPGHRDEQGGQDEGTGRSRVVPLLCPSRAGPWSTGVLLVDTPRGGHLPRSTPRWSPSIIASPLLTRVAVGYRVVTRSALELSGATCTIHGTYTGKASVPAVAKSGGSCRFCTPNFHMRPRLRLMVPGLGIGCPAPYRCAVCRTAAGAPVCRCTQSFMVEGAVSSVRASSYDAIDTASCSNCSRWERAVSSAWRAAVSAA